MKAFTLYHENEIALRRVLRKLQDLGEMNCSFEQFNQIFIEWHEKSFPKENWIKYMPDLPYETNPTTSLLFRDDWFNDFLSYLVNYDIPEVKSNEKNDSIISILYGRIFSRSNK